jgi:heterodisulfide reductase subunit A
VKDVSGFIGSFDATLEQVCSTCHSERSEESQDPSSSLRSESGLRIRVGTIIVAIGAEELKPLGQYGYGKFPNVITQLELEQRMKFAPKVQNKGKMLNNSTDFAASLQNVVMINCVGARVPERTYCSRFCCMTAVKNATLIKEANPNSKVFILHRDLMAYGEDFENYYRKSMEQGVRYIRYDLEKPPEVTGNGKAEKVKVWHQLRSKEVEFPVDMVVLTTPLIPPADNEELSKMLKVPLSEQGFFLEAHLKLMPVEFATDGIYLCGSARWPTDIAEGICQAYAAASKAAIPMRRGYVKPEAITSFVNEDICSGCGTCVALCPYKAIELQNQDSKKVAHSITALCKGCGTCGAACPSGAITMNHFRNVEIMAQIEAMFAQKAKI